jgi:hypothetical protein
MSGDDSPEKRIDKDRDDDKGGIYENKRIGRIQKMDPRGFDEGKDGYPE